MNRLLLDRLKFNVLFAPLALLVFSTLVYWDVYASLIRVWYHSATFNHGFLILPLVGYFLWQERHKVVGMTPQASLLGCLMLVTCVTLESFGYFAQFNVIQHVALAGIVVASVVTLLGMRIALRLWFPLSLLVFLPPIGEEIVPWLQEITADMALWMLRETGIPVYRSGLYLSIPAGNFEVAEACSGVRFLIACIFVGYLYACVAFSTLYKRLLFIVFSVVMPIVANGIRVYGIIMIGHLSDMKYAAGADHLVYGWGFFLLVMVILILTGNAFSDRPVSKVNGAASFSSGWLHRNWWPATLAVAVPILVSLLVRVGVFTPEQNSVPTLRINPASDIQIPAEIASWHPVLNHTDGELRRKRFVGGKLVEYYVGWYNDQQRETQLVSSGNRLFDVKHWTQASVTPVMLSSKQGEAFNAHLMRIVSPGGKQRLVLYWYELDGLRTPNRLYAKLFQGWKAMIGQFSGGALMAISVQSDEHELSAAGNLLQDEEVIHPFLTSIDVATQTDLTNDTGL